MQRFGEALLWALALVVAGAACTLLGQTLVLGLPQLSWSSLGPHLLATGQVVAIAVAVALPLGVATAVYLVEYAGPGRWLVQLAISGLASLPSIIFGLFGLILFNQLLRWGPSPLAGGLTVALMLLPTVIKATEEALRGLPEGWRLGSLALGAGRGLTMVRLLLPAALPGVAAGAVLAVGRALGETAALLMTTVDSGRPLSVHLYLLAGEGLDPGQAYAAAALLIVTVLFVNGLAQAALRRRGEGDR